ncbi:ATP-binding cassette domain-containing protein [Candidatus Poribacteria bacterium]|nr:ATP-binding cassette domain-containing protein [Candidatus Poribacteria bacterium]
MNNLVRVVDLHKSYYDGSRELRVLKGIDLEVRKGEILAIIGASGVGKSTLLHLIGALDRPTDGLLFSMESKFQTHLNDENLSEDLTQVLRNNNIRLSENVTVSTKKKDREWLIIDNDDGRTFPVKADGEQLNVYTRGKVFYESQDVFALSERELDRFRNQEIGFVFQFHHLLSEFTAVENVAMGALIAGQNSREAYAQAQELLDYVGLSERFEHHPSELSGGERQRVAFARALTNQPKVVLADEPTGNLDRKTSEALLDLLWDLNDRLGQTFIIVTHNQALAQRADRFIHLVDGKVSDQVQVLDF